MAQKFDSDRFEKVLALADSNHSGEAQNALRMATSMLRKAGRTWGDVARLVNGQAGNFNSDSVANCELANEVRKLQRELITQTTRTREAERALAVATKERKSLQNHLEQVVASCERELQQVAAFYQREIVELRLERDRLLEMQGTKPRRAEVVRLLAEGGFTDREIARRAGVSPTTVGNLRRAANLESAS